jgi:hypothetical protein
VRRIDGRADDRDGRVQVGYWGVEGPTYARENRSQESWTIWL